LPPNNYTFKIRAMNGDGYWSKEFNYSFSIRPPWWKTWWFRILAIVFAGTLLYGFIQYRSRHLKASNVILEKKVIQRTNELNNSLAELKTAQDQLIQSEKMASLGELTSGIAHEIKNPLNFINNFSEINMELLAEIEEEQIPNLDESNEALMDPLIKTLKKNSEKINHHGHRIDGIVQGMLQHSRQGNLTKEPVNINSLCDESLKLAYHGFRAKEKTFNASFETRFDPDLPNIMVVPQDLSRVLLNLINNAFYTVNEKKKRNQSESLADTLPVESQYKPSVLVSTRRSEDKICITVSDNGMGIPSQIINKIFQPFFTTKPTGEGTGLGLSMSYDIISKSHGGELRAKTKEGIGTDFEIILPVK
jgi:signal transduction histidine kinase